MDSLAKAEIKLAEIRDKSDEADRKNRELRETIAKKIREFKED